jgi:transposase
VPLERHHEEPNAIQTNLGAIFVSLELSRSTWLITSLSPGNGAKMSKHTMRGGNVAGLLERFAQLRENEDRGDLPICRDPGGRFRRILDPPSAAGGRDRTPRGRSGLDATSRQRRRAKTDKIDGEALIRALLGYKRGEPARDG